MSSLETLVYWVEKKGAPPSPGLIPIKVYFQREGHPVEAIRWIRPRAGRKLKVDRSPEEAGMKDWQRRIETEARRTQAAREQYGEFQTPWYEREKVSVEDTPNSTKYSKGSTTVEIVNRSPNQWVIVENNVPIKVFPKERDAQEYTKSKFVSKSIETLTNWIEKEKNKIYFQPDKGEKPPEGVEVKQGKRKGYYYESFEIKKIPQKLEEDNSGQEESRAYPSTALPWRTKEENDGWVESSFVDKSGHIIYYVDEMMSSIKNRKLRKFIDKVFFDWSKNGNFMPAALKLKCFAAEKFKISIDDEIMHSLEFAKKTYPGDTEVIESSIKDIALSDEEKEALSIQYGYGQKLLKEKYPEGFIILHRIIYGNLAKEIKNNSQMDIPCNSMVSFSGPELTEGSFVSDLDKSSIAWKRPIERDIVSFKVKIPIEIIFGNPFSSPMLDNSLSEYIVAIPNKKIKRETVRMRILR